MNTNLFIPAGQQMTPSDLEDLKAINHISGLHGWKYKKLSYKLKDLLVRAFGRRDGYDLQIWYDFDWDYSNCYGLCTCKNPHCSIWAEHLRILERWVIGDICLHRPTGEFSYSQSDNPFRDKKSLGYDELRKQVKNTIEGRKKDRMRVQGQSIFAEPDDLALAFEALKRLVSKYKYLLCSEPQRYARKKERENFIRIRLHQRTSSVLFHPNDDLPF